MAISAYVTINGHDYTRYIKSKTGLTWQRNNANDSDAGRDGGDVMHTEVTSHQRSLGFKMGPMPFSVGQQLETDLQGHDDGVEVEYPDLKEGMCKRLFYNTSIQSALESFVDGDIVLDDVTFQLVTIKEATIQ